ncbi:MAG: cytochrome b [Maritimibacter sp.]
MAARNSPAQFGWVTRLLHWLMALGMIFMLGFGLTLARMQPSLDTLWLYGLHKSIGICLLTLVLLRILWHRISPPPAPLGDQEWQLRAAHLGHALLYILMLAVPLVGWIASSASGISTVIFGTITLPRIAPVSTEVDHLFFTLHSWLNYLLIAVLTLHVAAALMHELVQRDGTLRRMLRGA